MTRHGLIIGKFLPLHLGHRHLIETALTRCDELTIVLFGRSVEPIPLAVRQAWLAELFPAVRVVGGMDDHPVDFDDDDIWKHWIDATLAAFDSLDGRRPDVVFSSEEYGAELARRLGADSEVVDLERTTVPVSGSLIRADPLGHWHVLDPPVRAWFAKRVAVVGAESTGKSTLCAHLADHFDTTWVPEYGREYCEVRGLEAPWTSDEFEVIAARQLADEDAAAREANRVVICDTDALATGIWHERYLHARHAEVEAMIRPYDLYLVTTPDVPWVDDGLRDSADDREWMTDRFVEELDARGARYELITGTWNDRDAAAIAAVERVLAERWSGATYHPEERNHHRRL